MDKRASKNFDIILEYLEVEWGEQVTWRFIKDVYDFMELLAEFPEAITLFIILEIGSNDVENPAIGTDLGAD